MMEQRHRFWIPVLLEGLKGVVDLSEPCFLLVLVANGSGLCHKGKRKEANGVDSVMEDHGAW